MSLAWNRPPSDPIVHSIHHSNRLRPAEIRPFELAEAGAKRLEIQYDVPAHGAVRTAFCPRLNHDPAIDSSEIQDRHGQEMHDVECTRWTQERWS